MALTRITQGVIKPNQNYDTHNINSTGIITATGANISGNMSVGGVLTYEDVTNIDSIGIITARNGLIISGVTTTAAVSWGGHMLPTSNATYDIGSADYKVRHLFLSDNSLKFVDSSDTEHPLSVDSGRLKFAGGMLLGNNIKLDAISGIITATNFAKADGSSLGGVASDSDGNTVGGTDAGSNLTTGTLYNTLFGYQAGQVIVPGSYTYHGDKNTFIGYEAGESCTTGYENVAIGYQAGNSFTTLPRSTLVGAEAGKGSTNGNDGVGYQCVGGAAGGASGYGNSGFGKYALSRLTSGTYNTCVGAYAGNYLSDGDRNTIMGENAGHMVNGNDNVIIGQDAAYDDNNSPFNTGSNCIIIGSHAMPTGQAVSNEITLGNSSITKFRIPGLSISIDSNGISDAKGNLRSIPQQNEQGSTHTLVAADAGKHILADNTVTVPPTSGIFSAGDAITIVNAGSSDISIAKGSGVTLYNAADGTDAGRTLAAKGMATILCGGVNTYYISGAGLS